MLRYDERPHLTAGFTVMRAFDLTPGEPRVPVQSSQTPAAAEDLTKSPKSRGARPSTSRTPSET